MYFSLSFKALSVQNILVNKKFKIIIYEKKHVIVQFNESNCAKVHQIV